MTVTLNWFEEQLTEQFGQVIFSEAQKEIMRRQFDALQAHQRQKERTNCWQVPLQIDFIDNGTYKVSIIDESGLLYLD